MKTSNLYKISAAAYAAISILYSAAAATVMKKVVKSDAFKRPENSKVPKLIWSLGKNVISNAPGIAITTACALKINDDLKAAHAAEEFEKQAEESRKALSESIDRLYRSSMKNNIDDEEDEADPADITFGEPHKISEEIAAEIEAAPTISMKELEKDEALHDEEVNLFD